MKINHDRLPRLTKSMLNNDTDFWDWYTRRLTTNRKFIRDTVARKSFSKLRSAIAGLYASRGLRKEAETAFTESCKLYPLSPEANFRLAEVYMSSMQFNKAADLIIKFHEMDPANTKALPFLERIKAVKATYAKIKAIENETKGGRLATPRALELAEYYRQIGQIGRFKGLLDSISRTRNIPPQVQYQVALAYAKAKYYPEMNHALDACLKTLPSNTDPQAYLQIANLYAKGNNGIGMANSLNKYLRIKPKDWRAWLDLASIEIQLKHAAEANAALNAAIRYGGNTARQEIVKNPLLNQLIKLRASRTKSLINMGMQ
jgi:Flp pilus assembly protein TadD